MPILGLGVHMLIALFFAVHAVRSGQPLYWLFILFSFPLLGSLAYFMVVFLPNSKLERGARKAVAAAARSLDPTRELREARAAFDFTPTAQNQRRLALALLEAGDTEEAVTNYEACLKGPFAADREIRFCAARAFVESGRHARAIGHLEEMRAGDPNFRPGEVSLLLARALLGAGRNADAGQAFNTAHARFGGFEATTEYAIWAYQAGDLATASRLQQDIDREMKRWDRNTRELNGPLVRRLEAAKGAAQQQR